MCINVDGLDTVQVLRELGRGVCIGGSVLTALECGCTKCFVCAACALRSMELHILCIVLLDTKERVANMCSPVNSIPIHFLLFYHFLPIVSPCCAYQSQCMLMPEWFYLKIWSYNCLSMTQDRIRWSQPLHLVSFHPCLCSCPGTWRFYNCSQNLCGFPISPATCLEPHLTDPGNPKATCQV